jgi:hypothetical protein
LASAAPTPIGNFSQNCVNDEPRSNREHGLGPLGAVGGIGGPYTFTAPFIGTLIMKVQPAIGSFAGDVFQAFVDGKSLGFTHKCRCSHPPFQSAHSRRRSPQAPTTSTSTTSYCRTLVLRRLLAALFRP